MKSYSYKGFVIVHGLCDVHLNMWHVMDWRNYDERIGAKPTQICADTVKQAKESITNLLFVEQNIPF